MIKSWNIIVTLFYLNSNIFDLNELTFQMKTFLYQFKITNKFIVRFFVLKWNIKMNE